MRSLRPFLLAGLLTLALPAAASAATVYETMTVPTVGGATISVEIARPDGAKVPVILTYSPYNTLGESTTPNLANDDLGARYVPKGYARAVADVIGTRNSTGCWDYGGKKEQQSGVDLVNALARAPWSNGKVAMIGGSYDGTTANMVAARGADAPGLAAIVPQSAISRWYGYAYGDGVRYLGNSENPADEGVDTPLAFDFGLTRTPPTKPTPEAIAALQSRVMPCDALDHTAHGYDTTPDYDAFWLERDYLKDAGRFRVPVFVTHGWQDYNVKQSEGLNLWDALKVDNPETPAIEGVPFKMLYVFQAGHANPSNANYLPLLDAFFDRTLKDVQNGVESRPPVLTEGRSVTTAKLPFRSETSWPPPGTRNVVLELGYPQGADQGTLTESATGPASAAYMDRATATEEQAERGPASQDQWLFYETAPLTGTVRLAGSAVLDAVVSLNTTHGHLVPVLVDQGPDGMTKTIARGFLNLLYRDGLDKQSAVPVDKPIRARVRFAPQDQTIEKGHRIGILMLSSNVVWAVPDQPGTTVTVIHPIGEAAGSRLFLPIVGPPVADSPTQPQGRPTLPTGGGTPTGKPRANRGSRAPRLALNFNRPGGSARQLNRRLRKGRVFVLRARARRDPVRGVTGVLYRLQGRSQVLIGRTRRPVTVGRRTNVQLRLSERFRRRGRYLLVLSGRNPDGRRGRATARFTLR